MKKFMVLYMANAADFERMMKESTPEQQKKGMDAWMKWMGDNKASMVDGGAPLGKSKRIDTKGSFRYEKRRLRLFGRASRKCRSGDKAVRQGSSASPDARQLGRSHRSHAYSRDVRGAIRIAHFRDGARVTWGRN